MANRYGYQFTSTLTPGVFKLFGKVAIGASGAPTLSAIDSKGVASIVRNSTGNYTITLQDVWYKFLDMQVLFKNASGIPAVQEVGIISEAVATPASKTINLVCSAAGSVADPASGDTMYFEITLKNSSAA